MTRKTALTPDQVRQGLRQRGETLSAWAKARGYDREAVYRVLNGKDKAYYGRAHQIAVDLGLKLPDSGQPSTAVADRNIQRRAVA